MGNKYIKLVLSIILCELAGIVSTPFIRSSISNWYVTVNKPFFNPPNWIFGPVWASLYLLMGVALYLVIIKKANYIKKKRAVKLFLIQLVFNATWPLSFFYFRFPALGFINILMLLLLIILTMRSFYKLSKTAFYLLLPYLLWVIFASVLNFSILVLN